MNRAQIINTMNNIQAEYTELVGRRNQINNNLFDNNREIRNFNLRLRDLHHRQMQINMVLGTNNDNTLNAEIAFNNAHINDFLHENQQLQQENTHLLNRQIELRDQHNHFRQLLDMHTAATSVNPMNLPGKNKE